jgi:hypothetical protein
MSSGNGPPGGHFASTPGPCRPADPGLFGPDRIHRNAGADWLVSGVTVIVLIVGHALVFQAFHDSGSSPSANSWPAVANTWRPWFVC